MNQNVIVGGHCVKNKRSLDSLITVIIENERVAGD